MVPTTGFRFNPTDEELIEILNQKVVSGNVAPAFDFIVERNLYGFEPQDLQWNGSVGLNNNERYYFCKRESDSREVAGRGWWKATSHVKTISANAEGVVGYKRPLTFHRFRDNQRKRKDAIRTDWIMHEYGLHSIPTDVRLCKIRYKGKERLEGKKEIRENIGAACGSSSMQLESENQDAFEEQQPLLPPILPSASNNDDYENYFGSNLSPCEYSSLIVNSMQPSIAPGYQHFAYQQDNNHQSEPVEQSVPFPDLWSSW